MNQEGNKMSSAFI